MLALLLALNSAAASPWYGTMGLDWVPLGRADLAWIEEDQLSGTLVSQTDGLLSPPLLFEAGAGSASDQVTGSLGLARIGSTTRTTDSAGDEVGVAADHVMGLRLGADYRRFLRARVLPRSGSPAAVAPYLQGGLYGVIPSARRTDTAWTAEEQSAQDDAAGGDRARIGALGARLGAGAELCLDNGLSFGLRGLVVLHRTQEAGEGFTTVSTLVFFEPALTVDLGF